MDPTTTTQPQLRAACLRHLGAYNLIGAAFARLEPILAAAGLFDKKAQLIGVYYDDPETVPLAELRSDAGILVPAGTKIPQGLTEVILAPGRYLTGRHVGPYDTLPTAWGRLRQDLQGGTGHQRRSGTSYEVYINNPMNAAPKELITDIFIPVE